MRQPTINLAGFFAAHSVWCVCEGETLIPIIAFLRSDGTQEFRRIEDEELENALARGNAWLEENPERAVCALLIYDGFITLTSGKTDAVILEIREFSGEGPEALRMEVPYRHATKEEGFAVHKPKFLDASPAVQDFVALGQAFFQGVERHDKGSAVWNAHINETI